MTTPPDYGILGAQVGAAVQHLFDLRDRLAQTATLADTLTSDYATRTEIGAAELSQDAAVRAWAEVANPTLSRIVSEVADLNDRLAAAL